LEIPRGRGVLKAKILEAKYEAKLEFLGGGCKTKTCGRGGSNFRYFLKLHIVTKSLLLSHEPCTSLLVIEQGTPWKHLVSMD